MKMKRNMISAALIIAFAILSVTPTFLLKPPAAVFAGIISTDFGDSEKTKNDELDSAKWFYTDALSASSSGKDYVLFGVTTSQEDRLINRNKIYNLSEYGRKDLCTLETVFQLITDANMSEAPREAGLRWGISFGLSYAGSSYGEVGSVFYGVEYVSKNTYDMILISFEEEGEKEISRSRSTMITGGKKMTLIIDIDAEGSIVAVMSGNGHSEETILNLEAAVPAEGYFGYVQNGTAGCRLYKFDMSSLAYGNPENPNIYETFSNGCYNAETLYSQASYGFIKGSGLTVQNEKLTFSDAAGAFMSTKYVYSNAEIAFDIPDMRRKGGYEGRYYIPETASFGVYLGADSYKALNTNYCINIKFMREGYHSYVVLDFAGKELQKERLSDKFNIWSEEAAGGKTVQIRIFSADGNISVSLKYGGESAYKEVLSYALTDTQLSEFVDGYIRIYADGNASDNGEYSVLANMTIDNLSITNFDKNANVITAGYRSNVWHTDDYDYIDSWDEKDLLR